MPKYTYRCHACGEEFEVVQSIFAAKLKEHGCGGHLERLISKTSFVLEGGGWAKNNYDKVSYDAGYTEDGSPFLKMHLPPNNGPTSINPKEPLKKGAVANIKDGGNGT